jgi:hypothetical protein
MKISLSYLAVCSILFAISSNIAVSSSVDFEREILPIFENKCFDCHSPKAKRGKAKAGLRLDTREMIIKGSKDNQNVLIPGNPDESTLYTLAALEEGHEDIMPPSKKGKPLSETELKSLYQWIKEGADFKDWTAFEFKD